jgi:hypothetical protein
MSRSRSGRRGGSSAFTICPFELVGRTKFLAVAEGAVVACDGDWPVSDGPRETGGAAPSGKRGALLPPPAKGDPGATVVDVGGVGDRGLGSTADASLLLAAGRSSTFLLVGVSTDLLLTEGDADGRGPGLGCRTTTNDEPPPAAAAASLSAGDFSFFPLPKNQKPRRAPLLLLGSPPSFSTVSSSSSLDRSAADLPPLPVSRAKKPAFGLRRGFRGSSEGPGSATALEYNPFPGVKGRSDPDGRPPMAAATSWANSIVADCDLARGRPSEGVDELTE